MRVFAGPNGSGKSTIINAVRKFKVKGIPVDFGIYVNADDIAKKLRNGKVTFRQYKVKIEEHEFLKIVSESGLLNKNFSLTEFKKSYSLKDNQLFLLNKKADERIAQIITDL